MCAETCLPRSATCYPDSSSAEGKERDHLLSYSSSTSSI